MSNAPQSQPNLKRYSPALIGAGVLVMALGFGLPMLAPGFTSESGTTPREQAPKQSDAKQATATPAPIQPPAATGLGASLLRLVIGLAVVSGLCVLVARWLGQKPTTTPGAMEVLASIQVSRCVVHLVRAGDRRLLIGTDLGGVKAILELPGPEPAPSPEPPVEAATNLASDSAPMTRSPAAPVSQEEILKLLLQLRTRSDAPSPG